MSERDRDELRREEEHAPGETEQEQAREEKGPETGADDAFDRQMEELLNAEPAGKKGRKRRLKGKKKAIAAAAVVAAVAVLGLKMCGGQKESVLTVATAPLEKGDIQNILSVSGPVSGTDSVDVVSNIHAKIKSIEVKEGDRVAEGQLLAVLDDTELVKELEIAQNSYDLAVANREENLKEARNGYAKAVQDCQAAQANYDRLSVLAQAGSISPVELEAAANQLNDARRAVDGYNLENGQVVPDRSFDLQIQNAQFNLDKARENLEEAQIKAPIAGTVVRVNSKVGQFANDLEDNKPIFIIENLDTLELEIQISEYSIGQVEVGQKAAITADIMGDQSAEGEVVSISPTGEEKGGGSSERVIPTTIRVLDKDTRLIAGITAKAGIVLDEARDTWVVPISALYTQPDGTTALAVVENGVCAMVPVTAGVESDISVEVLPAEGSQLTEGMEYIVAPPAGLTAGTRVAAVPSGAQDQAAAAETTAPEGTEASEESGAEPASEDGADTDESGAQPEAEPSEGQAE